MIGGGGLVTGRRGLRLWVKLALLAAVAIVMMHSIHLAIATSISSRSLVREQEALGRGIARLVSSDVADPILTGDAVSLNEIVARAASTEGIAYCFVLRNGKPIASSFGSRTPSGVIALREGTRHEPMVVVDGWQRYLDVEEPVAEGRIGTVRVGVDMSLLQSTRRAIAIPLGILALALVLASVLAALVVARTLARPIDALVAAADRFDPAVPVQPVSPGGGREIATLTERFNGMMRRLRSAHEEQERVRAQALANARLVALGSLVAGVAHEVNNPITSLKACVTLLRDPRDERARAQDLDLMDEALDRLRDMVQRLLDLARPRPLDLAPTPLGVLASDTSQLAGLSFKQRRITIEQIVEPGAPDALVLADRKQIVQALLNLMLNAAYFSADGARVRLRLRSRDGFRGISVEDDGPGIAEEIRERVLDPFFTTKPSGEGTGLGLSVTRSIVDRHHGSLELTFPEHGGTVATVWLPVAEGAAAVRSVARAG